MDKYIITGMSCAACSARVEKAVKNVDGVNACSVNLLTNSMLVEGTASPEQIILAVQKAGYGIQASTSLKQTQPHQTKALVKRLVWSVTFMLVLMYISMGHSMLSLPLFPFIENNAGIRALLQLVLSAIVLVINKKFFINGFMSALRLSPNMDTLVALGSGASFVYSSVATAIIIYAEQVNNTALLTKFAHNLYFESAAMIVTLITVGKLLESYSKGKTTTAIKELMSLAPDTVTVIKDGKEQTIPAHAIKVGDIFVVRAGERIAVDGIIQKGSAAFDQSSLTGESMPVDKKEGDTVLSSTINLSGFVTCKATKVGQDTTLAKVIKTVTDAAASKAPISKAADKVAAVFVPFVLLVAVITFACWLFLDKTIAFALEKAICVLVISCPCSLGLATPVAIMVASGVGAKNGILFKTATAIENLGKIKTIVFDKTGTITNGKPVVTDVLAVSDQLLFFAHSLELLSEHPLATSVVAYCVKNNIPTALCNDFEVYAGGGVSGTIQNSKIIGGNENFVSQFVNIPQTELKKAQALANEGKTLLFFVKDSEFLGTLAVFDTVKTDSKTAITQLEKMGVTTLMLTGDNKPTAQKIAADVGISKIVSNLLPQDKANELEFLKKTGKVAMVGDGINDAAALTVADVGIAIGAGTDIAIDSADVVLVNSSLSGVPGAIKLGRSALKNIRINLFWAFFYNTLGIPLAAGVFGFSLSPMFAALAMSLSSFCVVTNALMLGTVNLNKKENKKMQITLKVEGMMCPHCENHVKTALEKISGVKAAQPSHKKGEVEIFLETELNTNILITAIESAGYKVIK